MSVLLVGLDEDLTEVLIGRLVAEGDEVRVLEADERAGGRWRSLGAHLATGPQWDADLIERAAQNVRTIVVGARHHESREELLAAVLEGGAMASKDMRVVVVGDGRDKMAADALRSSPLAYVLLGAGRRTLLTRKRSLSVESLAGAVDAADDLAGEPRLELDLGDDRAWRELRLAPPGD